MRPDSHAPASTDTSAANPEASGEAAAGAAPLNAREDAFYGSAGWREGPREAVVSLIETYVDTLLWLAPASIEDLRRGNGAPTAPAS